MGARRLLPPALGARTAVLLAGLQLASAFPGAPLGGARLQRRPLTDAAGHCQGSVVKNVTFPLGQCVPGARVGSPYNLRVDCNASGYAMQVFLPNDTTCSRAVQVSAGKLGVCLPGDRGTILEASCNATVGALAEFSLAPAVPANISCASTAGTSGLPVECVVDPSTADLVSFEVGLPSQRPFVSYTAAAGSDGKVKATVPGLHPGTQYQVVARAHRRNTSEGNPDTWSALSTTSALCSMAAALPSSMRERRDQSEDLKAANAKDQPATKWLEVFRIASRTESPDFLDQHNSADLVGSFSNMAATPAGDASAVSRYCVQVLDVTLSNVTTADSTGKPQPAPFADYLSCNAGDCRCMHQVDRTLAHLPAKQILDQCSGPIVDRALNSCVCPAFGEEQSRRFVGRCPVPLPFSIVWALAQHPFTIPDSYPPKAKDSPLGHFFSHPVEGRCAHGVPPGQSNCTWQRSPLVHTVFLDDLTKRGMTRNGVSFEKNQTTGAVIVEKVDFRVSMRNIHVAQKAFADLGVPPCGADPSIRHAAQSQDLTAVWV